MKETNPKKAIILLIILIAIGGVVLYGRGRSPSSERLVPPPIQGPSTPPPGYETR